MQELTQRQRQVVALVRGLTADRGFPPTVREVAAGLGVHVHAAAMHLRAAQRKGALRSTPRTARSTVVLLPASDDVGTQSRREATACRQG